MNSYATMICVSPTLLLLSMWTKQVYQKGSHKSYIDHVVVLQHMINKVLSCEIIGQNDIIASDHIPIRESIDLHSGQEVITKSPNTSLKCFPCMKWDLQNIRDMYESDLSEALVGFNLDYNISNSSSAEAVVNECFDKLTNIIHSVCENICKKTKKTQWSQTSMVEHTMYQS